MIDNRLESSLTHGCMQYGWSAKHYFPCSPKKTRENPLGDYYQNLKVGAAFAHHDDAPKLIIIEFVKIKINSSILVMCESEVDWCERGGFFPWLICEITFENGFFIHYNHKDKPLFEKDVADQEFCIKQGRYEVREII